MKPSILRASHRLSLVSACLVLFALATGCAPASEPTSQDQVTQIVEVQTGPVVAVVNGAGITADEVDLQIRETLFAEKFAGAAGASKLFDARSEAIDDMIQDQLVAQAASKAGLAEEAWLSQAKEALPAVSDEEVTAFFEENKSRLGTDPQLDQFADRIRTYLMTQQEEKVYQQLYEAAEIQITLERERTQIAGTGASMGPENAPITIIEFSDFQCPYCARVVPTLKKIRDTYPESVRVVFRHLPLNFHSQAKLAAQASVCADDQDQFWAFHDKLFEDQKNMGREKLVAYATELELDLPAFESCLDSPETVARVDADLAAAAEVGATGTPAFYVNGIMLSGAQPFENFQAVIEDELAQEGS